MQYPEQSICICLLLETKLKYQGDMVEVTCTFLVLCPRGTSFQTFLIYDTCVDVCARIQSSMVDLSAGKSCILYF